MTGQFLGIEMPALLELFLKINVVVLAMTVVVMGLIYGERKIIGRFQMRLGPTRTGPFGILQSVADAIKLVSKEDLRPAKADPWVFELSIYFIFVPVFVGFVVVPFAIGWEIRSLDMGLLYLLATSSVSTLGFVMAGWASDNRYAMLGAMRAVAQGVAYEIPLVVILLAAAMITGTLNISDIALGQSNVPNVVWQPLGFVIFYICMLAELNRAPFDISVGESETAGGPHIEFSGIRWSMFQLAEYAHLWIMSIIGAAIFLGGSAWPWGEELGTGFQLFLMGIKSSALIFLAIWTRATLPRLRVDQLMGFAWKVLMPLAFLQVLVNGFVQVYNLPLFVLTIQGLAGLWVLNWAIQRAVAQPAGRPGLAVWARTAPGSEAAS
jgi:NADH-quinone oxidoreductase subunit H